MNVVCLMIVGEYECRSLACLIVGMVLAWHSIASLAVIGVDIIRLRTEYTYMAVSIFLLSSSVYVRIVSAIFILAILVVKREILCSQLVS